MGKILKLSQIAPAVALHECYEAGRDYGVNGLRPENARPEYFLHPQGIENWRRGRDDVRRERGRVD